MFADRLDQSQIGDLLRCLNTCEYVDKRRGSGHYIGYVSDLTIMESRQLLLFITY